MYRVLLEVYFRDNPDNPDTGYVASPEDIALIAADEDHEAIAFRVDTQEVPEHGVLKPSEHYLHVNEARDFLGA